MLAAVLILSYSMSLLYYMLILSLLYHTLIMSSLCYVSGVSDVAAGDHDLTHWSLTDCIMTAH